MAALFLGLAGSYLLGSIPAALIAGKVIAGVDIRTVGSGNAGATNLYRVAGLKPYLLVLAADILKGYAAAAWVSAYAAGALGAVNASIACGAAAVVGHIFSLFAGFKGGKGVATAAGMMLAIVPGPLLAAGAVYLAILYATSYVSLGSIGAALSIPVTLAAAHLFWNSTEPPAVYAIAGIMAAIILATHRENIARLLKGGERKTEFFKKDG